MRAFLAITPDAATCRAIETWRIQCWPVISRAVPIQNYHITLAFLGDISPAQLSKLEELTASFSVRRFSLTLNEVGYWPDAQCLWLGPAIRNDSLQELGQCATQLANRIGVRVSKKTFSPHLTLARRVDIPPAPALVEPDFTFDVQSVELYQSLMDRAGVRYVERGSWALSDNLLE